MAKLSDPAELRCRIRTAQFTGNTVGQCPGFVQANVVILPRDWAMDFLMFCQRNAKPCPLLLVSEQAGDHLFPSFAEDFNILSDIPRYRLWQQGNLVTETNNITAYWRNDLMSFFIGCSFSFEEALLADGLELRHHSEGVNVPMYKTTIPCEPAGRFSANTVVSMRPFVASDVIRMIQICSRFPAVHGAPIHIGDPSLIGIQSLDRPDFGDAVTIRPNEIPVFTACGVTPQEAIVNAKPPFCITHSPGCMAVSDWPNSRLAML